MGTVFDGLRAQTVTVQVAGALTAADQLHPGTPPAAASYKARLLHREERHALPDGSYQTTRIPLLEVALAVPLAAGQTVTVDGVPYRIASVEDVPDPWGNAVHRRAELE